MSIPSVSLSTGCGFAFLLTFNSGVFLARPYEVLLPVFLSSSSCTHAVNLGEKDFTLFLANAFLIFPIAELPKFKQFLVEVDAFTLAKEAA